MQTIILIIKIKIINKMKIIKIMFVIIQITKILRSSKEIFYQKIKKKYNKKTISNF